MWYKKRLPSETGLNQASGTTGVQPGPSAVVTNVKRASGFGIIAALFGTQNPKNNLSDEVAPPARGAFYQYYEGAVFTPGTKNWVFEPTTETTPIQPIWGRGFQVPPNFMHPLQPPQIYVEANVFTNGIGGVQAGQFISQPLSEEGVQ